MACRLFGAKPLSEPILGYCLLNPKWNFDKKYKTFRPRKCICKNLVQNGRHFCPAGDELIQGIGPNGQSPTLHAGSQYCLFPAYLSSVITANTGQLALCAPVSGDLLRATCMSSDLCRPVLPETRDHRLLNTSWGRQHPPTAAGSTRTYS